MNHTCGSCALYGTDGCPHDGAYHDDDVCGNFVVIPATTTNLAILDEFRTRVLGETAPAVPTMPTAQSVLECLALIDEERGELGRACAAGDVVGIADGVADLIVVATQLTFRCGIPIDDVLAEVHRSNMTKVGGAKNAAGKFVKPSTYEPADVKSVLEKAGWDDGIKTVNVTNVLCPLFTQDPLTHRDCTSRSCNRVIECTRFDPMHESPADVDGVLRKQGREVSK